MFRDGQYRQWVQETIDTGQSQRENHWTQSIAVGSVGFVEEIKARLGNRRCKLQIPLGSRTRKRTRAAEAQRYSLCGRGYNDLAVLGKSLRICLSIVINGTLRPCAKATNSQS
jgi:hypothetical protein